MLLCSSVGKAGTIVNIASHCGHKSIEISHYYFVMVIVDFRKRYFLSQNLVNYHTFQTDASSYLTEMQEKMIYYGRQPDSTLYIKA